MQSQMEAKLASMNLKSPGFTASPTTRNFNLGPSRTSSGDNFLSPDSATLQGHNNVDAANTLAQQRAKLKASNAAHRISAPILATGGADNRNTWSSGLSQLGQVAERPSSPAQEITLQPPPPGSRPKSTDFSGAANSFRVTLPSDNIDSPTLVGDWASMVKTPRSPMFPQVSHDQQRGGLDGPVDGLNDWDNKVPIMGDAKKYRRPSKGNSVISNSDQHQEDQQNGGDRRGFRNVSGTNPGLNHSHNGNQHGPGSWGSTLRSPALLPNPSGLGWLPHALAFPPGADTGGFTMDPNRPNYGIPPGIPPLSPAELIAVQLAAYQQNVFQQQQAPTPRANRPVKSPGIKSSASGRTDKKDEEEVDPKILEDVPAWLRSLRLHKYTPNFEGMGWRDMVILDEAQLEAKGVAALGARRKMLKTFEVVRKKMNVELPTGASTTTPA